MRKVLIVGANSYIGGNLLEYFSKFNNDYYVETLSLRNNEWKSNEFSEYETIIYTIGIAHQRERKTNYNEYYLINRDLTYEFAKKVKRDGVKHFIYLSSMSVYGLDKGIITKNTVPQPITHYGKSKLESEKLLEDLEDDNFYVSILRPPMIYGQNCKGNYQKLSKLSKISPIFPAYKNKRSMMYIGNLCELIRLIVNDRIKGLFTPQDKEYVSTYDLVRLISENNDKKIVFTSIFNFLINRLDNTITNKLFGDLVYDKNLSHLIGYNYWIYEFEKSIYLSERK